MNRIHSLMGIIESKTGMMFHDYDPGLFEVIRIASDTENGKAFIIESLNKIIDKL